MLGDENVIIVINLIFIATTLLYDDTRVERSYFHACMKKYDIETRQNMRKKPYEGGFRMF